MNGSQGIVYDIGWAPGADVKNDPPLVVMVGFWTRTEKNFVIPMIEKSSPYSG